MAPKKSQKIIPAPPPIIVTQTAQIEINGMLFTPIPGVQYRFDYFQMGKDILDGTYSERDAYRTLLQEDSWALLYFVRKIARANHPFIVQACRDVDLGPADATLDLWGREHFKAVDINELVPTQNGWRRHGDLQPGDFIFGSSGKPTEVLAKTEVFTDADCFRVTFADGYSVIVSGDHLWTVGKKSKRRIKGEKEKRHRRDFTVLSTEELSKKAHIPDKRYCVGATPKLEYPIQDLLIDPYVLGAWLGDGTSVSGNLTSADLEVIEEIRTRGFQVKKNNALYRWNIVMLRPKLRAINVLGNKHIPDSYLRSGVDQRLDLLQGLMDTDGTSDTRGTATFVNINGALAKQVFELAGSLGLNPRIRQYASKINGKRYLFWQVSFQSNKSVPVFRLPRKLARASTGIKHSRAKCIISVEPVEARPVSCIQVAAEDGQYVIGSGFVLTHNSTIITETGVIKSILNDPNRTHGILAYNRSLAQSFLVNIKQVLEGSQFLKDLFPDILYQEPSKESEAWGVESGLLVKRSAYKKERTVEAWGLIDGQPTGRHFDERIYDDIVTHENSKNPEQQVKVLDAFMMSHNLGSDGGNHRVIGTPYHYADAINSIRAMKRTNGESLYHIRLKPSLFNGEPNGEPVLLSKERIEFLRQDEQQFFSQHLLDPTPKGSMKLDPSFIKEVEPHDLPKRLYKFMVVDGAGQAQRREDSWAIVLVGVEPTLDDAGGCNVYILDAFVEPMEEHKAIDKIVEMYKRAGRVEKIGIEKVGMASTEVHVANALRAAGRHVSIDTGTLEILRPGGRKKEDRILKNLQWPLCNGKFHISRGVPAAFRKRLEMEMEKFPFATHDDFVDAISYVFDILADYRFPKRWVNLPESSERYENDYGENKEKGEERDWMTQ